MFEQKCAVFEYKGKLIRFEWTESKATWRARTVYLIEYFLNNHAIIKNNPKDSVDLTITNDIYYIPSENSSKKSILNNTDGNYVARRDEKLLKKLYVNYYKSKKLLKRYKQFSAIVVSSKEQQFFTSVYCPDCYVIPDSSFYHTRFNPSLKPRLTQELVFTWDGQGHNYTYIHKFILNNYKFFSSPMVRLQIITDELDLYGNSNRQRLNSLNINAEFITWSENNFIEFTNAAHVGLAIVDTKCKNARSKPENKLVNYSGLGLFTLCSNIRSYNEFLVKWPQAGSIINENNSLITLSNLKKNILNHHQQLRSIRETIINSYDSQILLTQWLQIIEKTLFS